MRISSFCPHLRNIHRYGMTPTIASLLPGCILRCNPLKGKTSYKGNVETWKAQFYRQYMVVVQLFWINLLSAYLFLCSDFHSNLSRFKWSKRIGVGMRMLQRLSVKAYHTCSLFLLVRVLWTWKSPQSASNNVLILRGGIYIYSVTLWHTPWKYLGRLWTFSQESEETILKWSKWPIWWWCEVSKVL